MGRLGQTGSTERCDATRRDATRCDAMRSPLPAPECLISASSDLPSVPHQCLIRPPEAPATRGPPRPTSVTPPLGLVRRAGPGRPRQACSQHIVARVRPTRLQVPAGLRVAHEGVHQCRELRHVEARRGELRLDLGRASQPAGGARHVDEARRGRRCPQQRQQRTREAERAWLGFKFSVRLRGWARARVGGVRARRGSWSVP